MFIFLYPKRVVHNIYHKSPDRIYARFIHNFSFIAVKRATDILFGPSSRYVSTLKNHEFSEIFFTFFFVFFFISFSFLLSACFYIFRFQIYSQQTSPTEAKNKMMIIKKFVYYERRDENANKKYSFTLRKTHNN